VYFFKTLMQTVNHHADFDNSDAVDERRVTCIIIVTKKMTVNEAIKALGVRNKLLGSQKRTL